MSGLAAVVEHVEHFGRRSIREAILDADRRQWEARALTFERAAHRPGIDWPGRAQPAELEGQRRRCLAAAEACRARARVSPLGGEDW